MPAPDFRTVKQAISGYNCHSYRVPDQEYEYQTILTFPMSAPIKEPIEVDCGRCGNGGQVPLTFPIIGGVVS